MKVDVIPSTYKDQKAITLETEIVRAQFLPEVGAKLASLVYKPLGHEILVQRPNPNYLLQPFDGDYVAGECSGMDDMFPTIDTIYYDRFPWQGIKMADHGEVWSLPWDTTTQTDKACFSVSGVRFPYRLEKVASFPQENILHIDYRLTNLSDFDLDYVWAAHAMINLEENAELALPEGVASLACVFDNTGKIGGYGDEISYPIGTLLDGSEKDFRNLLPKSSRDNFKAYINEKMPEGWCGVKFHESKFSFYLSFPTNEVPYLGILPNEGGWQDLYNIFLEPCTATFDRPDVARYRRQASTLKGKTVTEWHLDLILAEGCDSLPPNLSR